MHTRLILLLPFISFIITRHDIKDETYLDFGKKFDDVLCHFPMGEGTVTSALWVVTAGHIGKDLQMDIGKGRKPAAIIGGVSYDIETVYVHESFRPIVHDIALVKLAKPVQLKRYAQLYTAKNEIGQEIVIAGRGDKGTGLTGPQEWDKKTRAATNKIDGVDDHWIWFTFDAPSSGKATPLEGISGPGDSGGPAFIQQGNQLYLAGISSNQKNDGKKGVYGVTEYYTRISAYAEWIRNIQQSGKPLAQNNHPSQTRNDSLQEYAGSYGFRKIIYKNKSLFFQREDEPLISMRKIGTDLFIWDDENTKLRFTRNGSRVITGFQIQRRNGEVVDVKKDETPKNQVSYFNQQPPGMSAELFAPGIVSTSLYEHSSPAFSPDGSRVLWALADGRGYLLESIFQNGEWSKPAKPSFLDTAYGHVYPTFSADGKKLYFSSDRPVRAGAPASNGNRLWVVEIKGDDWSTPYPVDTALGTGQYANSVSANGNLYFSGSTTGRTNWNLYRSRLQNGRYGKAEILPFNINSSDYDDGIYIAPDESFLIFESQRPEGTDGNLSLFISFNKNGEWSVPLNMGPKINSGKGERFARLSPDGKFFFFGSFRNPAPGSRGADIYWIDAAVINELRRLSETNSNIPSPLGSDLIKALDKGETDAATSLMQNWMQANPQHMDAKVIFSSLLRKQKRFREAEQLFLADLSQWNNNSGVVMERALIQYGLNNSDAARTMLESVLAQPMDLRKKLMYLSEELFTMGIHRLSDEYFDKGMAIRAHGTACYNRACAYAQAGDKNKAFELLNKALDAGFNTKSQYENDKDLEPLKNDPRWAELLKKLR